MNNWKEIESNKKEDNIWRPEKFGERIVGVVLKIEKEHDKLKYTITTDDSKILIMPGHKMLMEKLEPFKEGERVLIKYEGEKDVNKPNPMKIYRVFRDEPEEESVRDPNNTDPNKPII